MKRRVSLLTLGVVAVAALLSGTAQAAAPTNLVVTQASRVVNATWTLPTTGTATYTGILEFSLSPAMDAYGFTDPSTNVFEFDDTSTSFNSAPLQFPAGTYYVHVSAIDPACLSPMGPVCVDEFSAPPVVITIPADPPPAPPTPPAPPPPPPDKVTTFAKLAVSSSQDVDKLVVSASMGEAGTLTATGTVSVPGASKVFNFKSASAKAIPGVVVKLRPKLAKKAVKAVKKALKRHKKVKANLTITAKDSAGNVKIEKRTVKLKP